MKKVFCLVIVLLLGGCKKPDANGMYADGTLAKGYSALEGTVKERFSGNLLPSVPP